MWRWHYHASHNKQNYVYWYKNLGGSTILRFDTFLLESDETVWNCKHLNHMHEIQPCVVAYWYFWCWWPTSCLQRGLFTGIKDHLRTLCKFLNHLRSHWSSIEGDIVCCKLNGLESEKATLPFNWMVASEGHRREGGRVTRKGEGGRGWGQTAVLEGKRCPCAIRSLSLKYEKCLRIPYLARIPATQIEQVKVTG